MKKRHFERMRQHQAARVPIPDDGGIQLSVNDQNMQFLIACAAAHGVTPNEVLNRCITMAANMGLGMHAGMFFAAYWNGLEQAQRGRVEAKQEQTAIAPEEQVNETAAETLARLQRIARGGAV